MIIPAHHHSFNSVHYGFSFVKKKQLIFFEFDPYCLAKERASASLWQTFKEALYEGSIFQVLNRKDFQKKVIAARKLPFLEALKKQASSFGKKLAKQIFTVICVGCVAQRFFDNKNQIEEMSSENIPFRYMVILGPIVEEVVNAAAFFAIRCIQRAVESTPSLKNKEVICFLSSSSARVALTATFFSSLHLTNAGGNLSTAGAVTQAAKILIYPSILIDHETSSTIALPITGHMMNNGFAYFMLKVFKERKVKDLKSE